MQKILFVASDPIDQARLCLMEELRRIRERIRLSKYRDQISVASTLAARTVDLTQALLDEQPTVLHFSGHGSANGAICLQNDAGETKIVEAQDLGTLLSLFTGDLRCVVLNACYSSAQADAIVAHIDYVVAMPNTIDDDSAIAYSIGFYSALGAGRSIEDSHKIGVAQIAVDGLLTTDAPRLLARIGLGTPAFVEAPRKALAHIDYRDLILLMTDDAGLMLVRSLEVTNADLTRLQLSPDDDRESGYISRLQKGMHLCVAFGSTAFLLAIVEVSQTRTAGRETWLIVGSPNRGPYIPTLGEMSALGYSADAIAEMRARRILLDERLPVPSGVAVADLANQSMLEMFVRGFNVPLPVTQSPLPGLYAEIANQPALFLAAARLVAVLWLRLSGVIATVDELSLNLDGSTLSVQFRGERFRAYQNANPTVLQLTGTCRLDRAGATLELPAKVNEVMFDGERQFDILRGAIVFSGEADGKRMLCVISEEALMDYFGAHPNKEGLLDAFDSNVDQIHRIAIALLRNGRLDDERRLFIRSADVSALQGRG